MLERSIVGSGYRPKNTTGAGGFSLIDGISIESIQKWMDIINKNIWACHPKKKHGGWWLRHLWIGAILSRQAVQAAWLDVAQVYTKWHTSADASWGSQILTSKERGKRNRSIIGFSNKHWYRTHL